MVLQASQYHIPGMPLWI